MNLKKILNLFGLVSGIYGILKGSYEKIKNLVVKDKEEDVFEKSDT